MARLILLAASPRVPAGLLSRDAWRALDAAERLAAGGPAPSPSLLLSRALAALDPERHGAAWAEHKRAQLDEVRAAARAALVERLSDSSWEALAAGERLESLRSRAASWQ